MAVKYLSFEEVIDLLDLPSDIEDEEKVRIELDKFNFQNRTHYVLENK